MRDRQALSGDHPALTINDEYDALSEEIRGCTKCGLCATRHLVVVGRGDPTSRLVFIGEAPGANEDATGQAFVGKAGDLLDELLVEAEIKKFLIINVLKCRPPGNRFPGDNGSHHGPEVVDECTPWMDKQLAIVRPRAIVLVGGKAASRTIYRGRKMPAVKDMVGRWMRSDRYPGVELFAMYHTSYMLRIKNYDELQHDRIREETIEVLRNAQKVADGDLPIGTPLGVSERRDKGEQLNFF
jgi:uracil-DNA glycosylase family 4